MFEGKHGEAVYHKLCMRFAQYKQLPAKARTPTQTTDTIRMRSTIRSMLALKAEYIY
jgi:hypothetical protein